MREGWKGLIARNWTTSTEQKVHLDSPEAASVLGDAICEYGKPAISAADKLVLLCIGTDRSIGDALGPLVGSLLAETEGQGITVLGTLEHPVHASNLSETIDWISSSCHSPFTIAVDACLGRVESVGMLTVGKGSLKPGAGVNKVLPAVGNLYVTGVVNVGGFMEYFVLQNTRLSLVMRMAKVIACGIQTGVSSLLDANRSMLSDKGLTLNRVR